MGLEMLIMQNHRPDLILLDIMMPEMNGYEFCAKLQENEDLSLHSGRILDRARRRAG